MNASIAMGLLFGVGAILVLTSQPFGAPRPSLSARLDALRPDRAYEPTQPPEPVFQTAIFEKAVRPYLEISGRWLLGFARRFGLDLSETATRLRVTGDPGGLGLFLGQKLATGLIGLAILPAASTLGLYRHTPGWLWLANAGLWFILPDLFLRSKAANRMTQLKEGLARFADLVSLSVSAGMGLEQAMEEVSRSAKGPFFEELLRALRQTRLHAEPASEAIKKLSRELDLRDAEPLAAALEAAESHGIALSQVLRAQAQAIRQRRRIELVEAGERAEVRMALPVGVLILPAFFVLVLYPAAVQLLQISAR